MPGGELQPWEPTWPADDLTRGAFRRRLSAHGHDIERGAAYPFLVFRQTDDAMVGGITVSNIRRGVAQMGALGYWIGEPFARRGHTVAAVRAVTGFCFGRLGLHRVEAACIPHQRRVPKASPAGGAPRAGFAERPPKQGGPSRALGYPSEDQRGLAGPPAVRPAGLRRGAELAVQARPAWADRCSAATPILARDLDHLCSWSSSNSRASSGSQVSQTFSRISRSS